MGVVAADTWSRTLVGQTLGRPVTLSPEETAAEKKVDKETLETVDAKAGTAGSAIGSASGVVTNVSKGNALQASADVLKLSAETIAKKTAAAGNLAASGSLIDSISKAAEGDTYAAASAASTAVAKFSPALAASPVGALTSAVMLGAGNQAVVKQAEKIKESAVKVMSPTASGAQRAKAALDLTAGVQGMATLGQAIGNAAVTVGSFAVSQASTIARLAPLASKLKSGFAKVATSPAGKVVGKANKLIPLLNIAGVAMSGKAAVDVFRNEKSSKTSKWLSIASIATAGAGLFAGLAMGGLPFIGIIGTSIAADLALSASRKRDQAQGDMDAVASAYVRHPLSAGKALAHSTIEFGRELGTSLTRMGATIKQRLSGQKPAPKAI